jgi:soluble lytic murein transglycosylase
MNDFPSPAPVQAPPQRQRRSGRAAARKRKKGFALWQWVVLSVLACGLLIACIELYNANGSLIQLRQERLTAQEKYEKTVRNHQPRYRDLIEKYASEYDLNPAYVSAIIMQESGYDPQAVSSKGAMGLMQFMPNTFDWVAPNCGISKNDVNAVYEPENAIKMGCYLLRYICRKIESDDPVLVACAYHAGWGTVPSWIENYSTDGKPLTVAQIPKSDTRTYAGRVLNSYAIYLQHYY